MGSGGPTITSASTESSSEGPDDPGSSVRRGQSVAVALLIVGALLMYAYHMAWTGGDFSVLLHGDERRYYLPGGLAILDQGLSWFLEDRSLWTGPLNPVWVATLGANVPLVKTANIGLFVIAGWFTWDIGRRLFGTAAAIISLGMFVTYVPFYRFLPSLLTEPVFVFLLSAAVWLVVRTRLATTWAALGVGVVLGLATLTRVTLQAYPVFLLLSWAVLHGAARLAERRHTRAGGRIAHRIASHLTWVRSIPVRGILLLLAGFVVVVVPYLAKNVIALDRTALANGSGAVLYIGNDLRTRGDEPAYSERTFDTGPITRPYTHLDTEGDRRLTHAAIERIMDDPVEIALLQPQKTLRLLLGSKDHYFYPQDDVVSFFALESRFKQLRVWDMVVTITAVVFGLVGLLTLRAPPHARLVMGSLIVYFVVIHTLLFPIPRLILPILPFLMVYAGGMLVRGRSRTRVITGVAVLAIIAFISFEGAVAAPGVSERHVSYFTPVASASVPADVTSVRDVEALDDGWFETIGDDPYVILGVTPFEGAVNQHVFITMIGEVPPGFDPDGIGQLFWGSDDAGFEEASSVLFAIRSDGQERIYRVSPAFRNTDRWAGSTIDRLRIDLPALPQGLRFRIAGVRVAG